VLGALVVAVGPNVAYRVTSSRSSGGWVRRMYRRDSNEMRRSVRYVKLLDLPRAIYLT
jgi:hypothetical protein